MKHILLSIITYLLCYHASASVPSGNGVVYEGYMVDTAPQFPGGDIALMKYINSERQYPQKAYHEGIQGRVRCGFIVNEDGRISDISVIRSVETSLDKEAVRIISEMPRWEAGELGDQPVPVYYILSIPFRK